MANLDFLDELANFLEAQSIGTAGEDIFVNKQPASVDNCIALFGRVGTNVQEQRDVPGLVLPRFQVLVRNKDYNDAADTYQAVRSALHGMINQYLPSDADIEEDDFIRVLRCHVDSEGGPLGEDGQGRTEISGNFVAEYHLYEQP